jgi:hypothetical protein
MTLLDYLVDTLLVLLVVRQIREARWNARAVLLPLAITGYVGYKYLHTIPTGGNDLLLIAGLTLVGVLCGTVSGLATRIRTDGGAYPLVRAGWVAAGIWVASMSARFAFAVWASHGGGPALARFTIDNHLTPTVWVAALVLMALGEVITRVGVVTYRGYRAVRAAEQSQPQAPTFVTV